MLKQRVVTGILLLVLFSSGLLLTGPAGFGVFIALIFGVGAWEWSAMSGITDSLMRGAYVLLMFVLFYLSQLLPAAIVVGAGLIWWLACLVLVKIYPAAQTLWRRPGWRLVAGGLVLVPAWAALVLARESSLQAIPQVSGIWLVLYLFVIVWLADIGAYFSGKRFGRRKLAPSVSPGKSIEGAIGGMLAVICLPLVLALVLLPAEGRPSAGLAQVALLMLVTAAAAALSVVGDLTESLVKRVAGVKDSGTLLPGHGGVMDRIDSITAAAPVFIALMLAGGWLQVAVVAT